MVANNLRMTHVFVAVADYPGTLTTLCGQHFRTSEVDFLQELTSAPCAPCLVVASHRR